MKKLLSSLLLGLLIISLAACGGATDAPATDKTEPTETAETLPETAPETETARETETETEPETEAGTVPSVTYPHVIKAFEGIPDAEEYADADLRQTAVGYMRAMANVIWTAGSKTSINFTFIAPSLDYRPGRTYMGMIYNWDLFSNFEAFVDTLENGVYNNDNATTGNVPGNTCSTSILHAWQTVSPKVDYSYTIDMMPGVRENGVIPVGNVDWSTYNGSRSVKGNTKNSVLNATPAQTVYEAYALLLPGDALMRQFENGGHALMCTGETTVSRKADGTIDPNKSYTVLTDQNTQMNNERGYPSSWGYDRHRSFSSIYGDGFLPVTIPELRDNKTEKPYIALPQLPSFNELGYGVIDGEAVSNYRLLTFTSEILKGGPDGEVIASYSAHPHSKKVQLRTYITPLKIRTLDPGVYVLRLTGEVGLLEQEILTVAFEVPQK